MILRVFAIVLFLTALAPAGLVSVTGYITAEMHPVEVEKVTFIVAGFDTTFETPGWSVEPAETTSFDFPEFIEFPGEIQLSVWITGQHIMEMLFGVRRDEWHAFMPPFDDVWVMFTAPPGAIEDRNAEPRVRFAVVPSVIREAAVIRAPGNARLEVFDAAGNMVRTMAVEGTARWAADDDAGQRLAEGVYFCRLVTREGSSVRKVLVAR